MVIPSKINGYTVTAIGYEAFKDNTSITSVTIPDSVTLIDEFAFHYCESLKEVNLGKGLKTIDSDAFAHCYALTAITIPDSVTKLGTAVFQYCQNLESVMIGKGLTQINHAVFSYCYYLASVTIPASVTYIGVYAFDDCPYITNVYYEGSQSAWQQISIDEENSVLTSATIHYNAY